MYRNAVKYKGEWLAPGSYALELLQAKKFKELDQHLAELDKQFKKLEGR